MKNSIKNYFENEVSQTKTPPMPSIKPKKVRNPWDNILLTALAVTSMVIIYYPGSYNSQIRSLEFNKNSIEILRKSTTRVISEVDRYYLEKQGVKSD